MKKVIAAFLALAVGLVPVAAQADHNWYGCPPGWDAEVGGYATASVWVAYRIQVDGGHFEDRWDYFQQADWPGFNFGSRMGIDGDHSLRIDNVHIFTTGSAWHIANKTCHAP